MKSRFVGLFAAILFCAGATAAFAQNVQATPAPAATPVAIPTMPPNTSPIVQSIINSIASRVKADYGWEQNRARGVVTYFHRFDMQVRFANGQYRTVHLHQGTVINPRGATIHEGDKVDVTGQGTSDGSLNANQITLGAP